MAAVSRKAICAGSANGPDAPWPYLPELLEQSVPRYTSYPTALDFHDGVGSEEYRQAVEAIEPGTAISLYVHIPYCHQICWYCGCNTAAAGRITRVEAYLEALEAELTLVGQILGGRANVQRIAFGGGSPNVMEPYQFVRLLDRITTIFEVGNPEISVEIDPRSFSADWTMALAAAKVSRVSLGVQTFAPRVQKAMGRIQPFEMIESSVFGLRSRGIDAINFDLMFGLPEQTIEDLAETVEQTLQLRPSRIALFGYAHLPSQISRQRKIDGDALPGTRLRFEQSALGYQMLTAAGYQAIGFDHFALPEDSLAKAASEGTMRRNFQGFTEDNSDILLGFGSTAISQFPGLIVQNEKHAGKYRDLAPNGKLAVQHGIKRGEEEQRTAKLVGQLLCFSEADLSYFEMTADKLQILEEFENLGLIKYRSASLVVTPQGRPYVRNIITKLIANDRSLSVQSIRR